MPKRSRAIIYVRGTSEEIDQQLTILTETCARRDYDMACIVQDVPDGVRGYHDAHRMLRRGGGDLIVFASTTVLPDVLESATGSLPGPRIREILPRAEGARRTRPIRRWRDAGA
jgi:hypothetical protein